MPFSESVSTLFTVKLTTVPGFSFAIALILSMAVAAYSLYSVQQFSQGQAWVDHTQYAQYAIVLGNLLSITLFIFLFIGLRRKIHQQHLHCLAQLQAQ